MVKWRIMLYQWMIVYLTTWDQVGSHSDSISDPVAVDCFHWHSSWKRRTCLSSFNKGTIDPETAFQSQIFIFSANWPFTVAALLPCPICTCTFPVVAICTWEGCRVLEAQVVFSVQGYSRSSDLLLACFLGHLQTLGARSAFLLMHLSIVIVVKT